MAAYACCFTTGLVWLHPSRADWPPSYSYRGRIGSLALRLACSPPESASPLLELALVRLHAEQAIYMVNSFQFTRSARLILAYPTNGRQQEVASFDAKRIGPHRTDRSRMPEKTHKERCRAAASLFFWVARLASNSAGGK
jgi:hypothetical protein